MIRQQFLTGTPIKQLLKVIKGQRIEMMQWRNTFRLFMVGALSSVYALRDQLRYGSTIAATEIEMPPIFILGHWRSGTTFLQTILCKDVNITTPTFFQCTFPQGFLSVGSRVRNNISECLPERRLFDSMSFDLDSPFDDEMATLKITGESMMLDFVFPDGIKNGEAPFRRSSKWPAAMKYFAKKLTFVSGKRLVFKSPVHGYRIQDIKKLFPQAKFIFLTRNPRKVYLSSKHQINMLLEHNALHGHDYDMESYITRRYQDMLSSFEESFEILDQSQYIKISYEQLVIDTLGTVEKIYSHFDVGDWEKSRIDIASWLETQVEYKPNAYDESEKIPREWMLWENDYNSENYNGA